MTERPMLMSAPMVRATLADIKTHTRRVVKVQPNPALVGGAALVDKLWAWLSGHDGSITGKVLGHGRCPYGEPGDRAWVREAFGVQPDCEIGYEKFTRLKLTPSAKERPIIHYRASADERTWVNRWRPSIHMPRWASRITLEVTGVRVERLQDISEADAIAEGCHAARHLRGEDDVAVHAAMSSLQRAAGRIRCDYAIARYMVLWESLHGPGSWDANPYVWVIAFRRLGA